jgi:hypothetical protein
VRRQILIGCVGLWALVAPRSSAAPPTVPDLPWNDLVALENLPRIRSGHQVLLRSSYCPDGCRFDRTSDGDGRFLRFERGEGVIFDEPGAGAIARIWMTMGPGVSAPLDPSIRIRIRLDGATTPQIDLPLPDLFRGDVAPFLAPLVADRSASSGGNVSYLPIPFRKGCVVSLVGARRERIWFQITFHRLASAEGVTSFSGDEDLSAWVARFARAGESPWVGAAKKDRVRDEVGPGSRREVARFRGADTVRALRVRVAPGDAERLRLHIVADGVERVAMTLAEFFGSVPSNVTASSTASAASIPPPLPYRTVLLGTAPDGTLYSFFPQPYRSDWSLELESLAPAGSSAIPFDVRLERSRIAPASDAGSFTAVRRGADPSAIGRDLRLATFAGAGKWVGLRADLSSVGTPSREYLEGDERVFLDGSSTPAHYGTGVEDFFNGGFYFDAGPFRQPLGGSAFHVPGVWPFGEDSTGMLRLLISDAVPFQAGAKIGLEGGPTGNLAMRAASVVYAYVRGAAGLQVVDRFTLGDASSRAAHLDAPPADRLCEPVSSAFDGEPPVAATLTACSTRLDSSFVLRRPRGAGPVRLRRTVDAALPGQEVEVLVDGNVAGRFPFVVANPHRRFVASDLDLPRSLTDGRRTLRVTIRPRLPIPPRPRIEAGRAEIAYELLAGPSELSID